MFGGRVCRGGHAITVAAKDKRIKAAVAIIPFLVTGKPSGDAGAIIRAVLWDSLKRKFGAKAGAIPVFAETPGEFAVMASDGGWDWMQGIVKHAPTYRNEITLRSLLNLRGYLPGRLAKEVKVPTLLMSAKADTITPAAPIADFAKKLTCKSEHLEYPDSHFELFGESLGGAVDQTVKWFKVHL